MVKNPENNATGEIALVSPTPGSLRFKVADIDNFVWVA